MDGRTNKWIQDAQYVNILPQAAVVIGSVPIVHIHGWVYIICKKDFSRLIHCMVRIHKVWNVDSILYMSETEWWKPDWKMLF